MKKIFLAFLILLGFAGFVNAAATFSTYGGASYVDMSAYRPDFQTYYSSNDLNTYWPILNNRDTCEGRQDILIQVAPAGCQPMVVRSDLLAEQNVPVFCQLNALQLNPLIKVENIRNIRFTGNYPSEVAGIGFHSAKAALSLANSDSLVNAPNINNIGYVVIVLKKNAVEKNLPNLVNMTLTAQIDYNAFNTPGVGQSSFVLQKESDSEWAVNRAYQSFWNGQYYLRLRDVDPNNAVVDVYNGDVKISSASVRMGSTSSPIYLAGSYCSAGFSIAYDGLDASQKHARVQINSIQGTDILDLYPGQKFLNGNCWVNSLEVDGIGNGNVSIGCYGSKTMVLQIKPRQTNFAAVFVKDLGNGKTQSGLPESSSIAGKLGFVFDFGGNTGIYGLDSNNNLLYKDSAGNWKDPYINPKDRNWLNIVQQAFKDYKESLNSGSSANSNTLALTDVILDAEAETAFNDAINSLIKISDDYPVELSNLGITYGEEALGKAIELAHNSGKYATEANLINQFLLKYPSSNMASHYKSILNGVYSSDSTLSSSTIRLNNQYYTIGLLDLIKPEKNSGAYLVVDGKPSSKVEVGGEMISDFIDSKGARQSGKIKVDKISDVDQIQASVYCNSAGSPRVISLRTGIPVDVCGGSKVVLDSIETVQVAKVRVLPQTSGPTLQTNFSVGIGIEKRGIKLSTEKTQEKINSLNASIAKWESISKSLGKVVTGLKSACFATSLVLTAKNFLTGLSGEAIARENVMNNYWDSQCRQEVALNHYVSLDDCFRKNADKINSDVKSVSNNIKQVNDHIKSTQGPTKSDGLFGQVVDTQTAAQNYANYLANTYKGTVVGKDSTGKDVKIEELLGNKNGYQNGEYSYNQLRQLELDILNSKNGGTVGVAADKDKELIADQILAQKNNLAQIDSYKNSPLKSLVPNNIGNSNSPAVTRTNIAPVPESLRSVFSSDVSQAALFPSTSGSYVLGLASVSGNSNLYTIKEYVQVDSSGNPTGSKVTDSKQIESVAKKLGISGSIMANDKITYRYPLKSPLEVSYYETEPNKGMPAYVPFDLQNGWYAATKQVISGFGAIGSSDSSGRITSFYVCNAGPDGVAQFFQGSGDDICEQVNTYTGQPRDVFPGMTSEQSKKIVDDAERALMQASQQYGKSSQISISTSRGSVNVKTGVPASNSPATSCADFMDPKDCHILFNVCDPVICPSSRCDFGGKYPVADVVQTGIVGSALLCLPNIKEGIAIPVCLTGIQAGIDGYLSILKSHKDCLQESLKTGKTIGICDEIYSVYLCEFFWRQIAPIANVLLPKIVELAYSGGQGARGGGEYLTVMGAWNNMQKSMDYFTQTYAVNSLKAFQIRSIEDVGTQFCRGSISLAGPTSLKSLVEPESPPQFFATFDAIPFSSATVPATSQYKVFYHIFAGKNSGVYYNIYLKNPPSSSYYASTQTIQVASGYAQQGGYASETKDFTAPEGYKELCVRINNEEKCGFKQVTTDFAANYIADSYASQQIQNTNINSDKECISGGQSILPILTTPNIQAGATEAALPQDYNRGITRICATQNPGSGSDPGRFTNVGKCDNPNMICWLDKQSISKAITQENVGIRNETLQSITNMQIQELQNNGEIFTADVSNEKLSNFSKSADELAIKLKDSARAIAAGNANSNTARSDASNKVNAILSSMDNQFNSDLSRLFYNSYKAQALLIKAKLKSALAEVYAARANNFVDSAGQPASQPASTQQTTQYNQPVFNNSVVDNIVTPTVQTPVVSSLGLQTDYDSLVTSPNYIILYYSDGSSVTSRIYISGKAVKVGSTIIGTIQAGNVISFSNNAESIINDADLFDRLFGASIDRKKINSVL